MRLMLRKITWLQILIRKYKIKKIELHTYEKWHMEYISRIKNNYMMDRKGFYKAYWQDTHIKFIRTMN